MQRHSQFSVIIPALNEENNIERAIRSVSWADEVVVVDGGSRDKTVDIAGTHARVLHAEMGRGRQLRKGGEETTGKILLFLHADSWLSEQATEELKALVADGENQPVFGCFRQRIDDNRQRFRILESGNAFRAAILQLPYGDQAIFVDRKTYEKVGGFDDVPLMEDVMLSRRLRRICRPTLLTGPVHLSARRWTTNGWIRQTLRNWALVTAFSLGVSPARLMEWYR